MVLRDWSSGKLARYTVPATPSPPAAASTSTPASTEFADIYAQDAAVLALLTPRKELRKAGGLVRLRALPTPTDTRRVALDESYFSTADGDGDDDNDDESGEDFGAELDAVSGDDEEEEVPKPKRKVRSCPSCNILFLTTITARLKAVFQKDFF